MGGYSDVKDRVGTVSRRHRISSGYSKLGCWSISIGATVEPAGRDIAPLHYGRGSVYIDAAGIIEPVDSQAMGPRHWVLAQWRASFRR